MTLERAGWKRMFPGRKGPATRAEFIRLRGDCQAKLGELGLVLPVPFTLEGFCQALGACLDHEIVLKPVDTRTGPCGMWVATDSCYYVFFERRTSPLHQTGIVGHEGGHAAFGHRSADVLDPHELARLLGLDVGLIQLVLGRTTYSDPQEKLAEVFGTLIVEHAVGNLRASPRPTDSAAATVQDRLQSALGPHR